MINTTERARELLADAWAELIGHPDARPQMILEYDLDTLSPLQQAAINALSAALTISDERDERALIVADLHRRAALYEQNSAAWIVLHSAADCYKRGDHLKESER